MKTCPRCITAKPFSEFNKNATKKDGYNAYCRPCMVEYKRQNYLDNRDRIRSKNDARKDGIREWFRDYKSKLRCELCGFSHPAALDFHHEDSTEKENTIAAMAGEGYGKETILAEIAKCKVLCSNCHRIHHYSERAIL